MANKSLQRNFSAAPKNSAELKRYVEEKIMMIKIGKYIVGILAIAGIYFLLVVPSYYTFRYFSDVQNHLRHEYIQGAILSVFVATWFWVAAAVMLIVVRIITSRTRLKKIL